MNYLCHILIMITLYLILGLSLNLVVGYGGMLSLCHGALYGVGAYTYTLLTMNAGCGFLTAAASAALLTGLVALLIAIPCLRFRGDVFVLGTLGFQMIVFSFLYNFVGLTRGPYGISGILKPVLFGKPFHSLPSFLMLSTALASLALYLHWQFTRSPFGRTLQAVRDDELTARALGKNPIFFRATAIVLAGCLAAVAGSLYATYVSYIDPTSFGLDESVFILMVVIIGGAGSLYGPVLGAVFVIVLPELLRFLDVPDAVAPNVRQIVFGLVMILAMRFRPRGIAGRYAFD